MKVITGMHRSGTSCVANLVQNIGGNLGDCLLAGDQWNEKGYFEIPEVTFLNDSLMLGPLAKERAPYFVRGEEPPLRLKLRLLLSRIPHVLIGPAIGVNAHAQLERTNLQRVARQVQDLCVKDVRFSVVLPVWRDLVRLDAILYCFRQPEQVIDSLQRRNGIPTWAAARLWRQFVQAFLSNAVGLPVVMISYNRLLDPRQSEDEVARVFTFLNRPYEANIARRALEQVVESRLQKHATSSDRYLPRNVKRVYRQLLSLHSQFAHPTILTQDHLQLGRC